MKNILMGVLCALVMLPYVLTAQRRSDANIAGHVVDSKTHEHIPFASITVKGTTLGVVCDASGHFLFKGIPKGEHTIVASCVGYNTLEKSVDITDGSTVEMNFELSEKANMMDGVVVTASRNETSRLKAPTIVNVLSTEMFENTSSVNLAEALNFQSGLRVDYSCSNCGVPQLRINGLEGQYSQILLDSRPIFSSLAAVYGLEQLPAGMIERTEVIRGGGSALFGANAIGGVVNIITKEPVRNLLTLSNTTSLIDGKSTDVNTSFNGSFVSDDYKTGIFLFAMIRDREEYDRDGDGFSEIPKLKSETIGFRGYYKTSLQSKITAEYHHIREFRRGGNLFDRPPHEADIAEQLRHGINGGGLKYETWSSDYSRRFNVYTSGQYIDRDSYFGTNANPDAYGKTDDGTFVAGSQYSHSLRKLLFMPSEFTVGIEYNWNKLHDVMLGYNRDKKQTSTTYGGYLQNEWKNDKLSLLIGARIDKNNFIKNAIVSPRANVRYTPHQNVILRGSYSSGYRAPQAYEEDLHVAAVGGEVALIEIDPDLKPEYSNSISASADLYQTFGQVQTNLLVEGFYTNLTDVFFLDENGHDDAGNLLLMRRNASGAVVKGINAEGRISYGSKLSLQVGYTFQNSRYKDPLLWSKSESVKPQRRMLRTPDSYGYMALTYNPIRPLSVSVSGNYTGEMLVPHYAGYLAEDSETLTPDFWDMGARIAYTLGKFEFNCGVKNVLDNFQKDLDKGAKKDAGYIYGPAVPRTFFIGLKFSL